MRAVLFPLIVRIPAGVGVTGYSWIGASTPAAARLPSSPRSPEMHSTGGGGVCESSPLPSKSQNTGGRGAVLNTGAPVFPRQLPDALRVALAPLKGTISRGGA